MAWRESGCGVRKVSVLMQEVLSMSKQKMFFSFEYNKDAWRAAQILKVGLDWFRMSCNKDLTIL